ncbi:MAG: sporulation protein YabP [Candidatus Reconcilbacillus cellulovorans]|uniref:Sporulation protein YabP n=1 Tax=Candidatus Reconcilbacillus cellulovorans TaxID=1906605 RepID=A0A2A6E2V1_9BACL|nr:MAG: sporulation protein YabP [Candidatus Reconcilbacillus cellulovorans]
MIEQAKPKRQEIRLVNRKTLEITGVLNVERFDANEFRIETEAGFLIVRGQNLHLKHLSLEQGVVAIDGYVGSLAYPESKGGAKGRNGWGKWFR